MNNTDLQRLTKEELITQYLKLQNHNNFLGDLLTHLRHSFTQSNDMMEEMIHQALHEMDDEEDDENNDPEVGLTDVSPPELSRMMANGNR